MLRMRAVLAVATAVLSVAAPGLAAPGAAAPGAVSEADGGRPVRIMALGDSITFGVGSPARDGYRTALHQRLARVGQDVDFVGSQRSGTGPDRDNEGHPGWTIAQLAARVDGWTAAHRPDVVLLHIGTNDMKSEAAARGATGRLAALIARLRADLPAAHLVVARITSANGRATKGSRQARTLAFNAAVPGIVARAGADVHLVDHSAVRGLDLTDGVHPNEFGYQRMAWTWYRALEPILNRTGTPWPAAGNPDLANTSVRRVDRWSGVNAPDVVGQHTWYRRAARPGAARTWQLPVRATVAYRVKVGKRQVVRTRVVLRWISG